MFDAVWEYLTKELLVDTGPALTRQQQDNLNHDAFLSSRIGLYVGKEQLQDSIDQYIKKGVFLLLSIDFSALLSKQIYFDLFWGTFIIIF